MGSLKRRVARVRKAADVYGRPGDVWVDVFEVPDCPDPGIGVAAVAHCMTEVGDPVYVVRGPRAGDRRAADQPPHVRTILYYEGQLDPRKRDPAGRVVG